MIPHKVMKTLDKHENEIAQINILKEDHYQKLWHEDDIEETHIVMIDVKRLDEVYVTGLTKVPKATKNRKVAGIYRIIAEF